MLREYNKYMKSQEKEWFLSLDREIKIKLLEDMLKDGEFHMAFQASLVLLDAPISQGGIESETISAVFDRHTEKSPK